MKGTVRGSTAFDIDGYFLEIRNGYNMFFTPRAVLRIGMLLRDRCPRVLRSHAETPSCFTTYHKGTAFLRW